MHHPLAPKHDTATPSTQATDPPRLLARLPVVLKVTGLGRSTIYRWIADGSLPAPVRLGRRAVAWRWPDLDRWTQSRATTHHCPAPRAGSRAGAARRQRTLDAARGAARSGSRAGGC